MVQRTSRTYKDITELVQEHYNPKPSTIVERFKFNSRNQQSGESISNYVANLRQMTEFCDFGISLEDMLRDRLVCGIHDIRIQRRLLAEPNLTFKKALELAIALETVEETPRTFRIKILSQLSKGADNSEEAGYNTKWTIK